MASLIHLCGLSIPFLMLLLVVFAAAQQQQSLQQMDSTVQRYAFQRLSPLPKTGLIYNVSLPQSLATSIISVQAVRLRSGSLRRHGLVFNEFTIPIQSLVETTGKYVVLIYRALSNNSSSSNSSYPTQPPSGFNFVVPVVGIKSYEGNDLNTSSPPLEVNIFAAPSAPITANFVNSTLTPFCAFLDPGSSSFKLSSPSSSSSSSTLVCTLSQLVDSSLVAQSLESSTTPAPAPAPVPAPIQQSSPAQKHHRSSSKRWKLGVGIAAAVVGGAMLLPLAFWLGIRLRHRTRIARMQYYADKSETLQAALIGAHRAPTAASTRTKPVLENDYLPPSAAVA